MEDPQEMDYPPPPPSSPPRIWILICSYMDTVSGRQQQVDGGGPLAVGEELNFETRRSQLIQWGPFMDALRELHDEILHRRLGHVRVRVREVDGDDEIETLCQNYDGREHDPICVEEFYHSGGGCILHLLLLLDAPCEVVELAMKCDPSMLYHVQRNQLPLHTACDYSPKNIEQVLGAFPAAANRTLGSHGFLPIEGYLMSTLAFRRKVNTFKLLLWATDPNVLERKDFFESLCAVLMGLIMPRQEGSVEEVEDLEEYYRILDAAVEYITQDYAAKERRRNKYLALEERDRRLILHAILEHEHLFDCLSRFSLLGSFMRRHREQISLLDSSGNTALHLLLKNDKIKTLLRCKGRKEKSKETRENSFRKEITRMIHLSPSVVNTPNVGKKLPLHYALERGFTWENAVGVIAEAGDARALFSRHPSNGLYPFMLAACGRRSDINSVFQLLKAYPQIISVNEKDQSSISKIFF